MTRLPAAFVIAALMAFLGTLAAITVLMLRGVDPLPLLAFLGTVPAAIAGAANLMRTAQVEAKVDVVSKNVNGHLSRLSDAAGIPPAIPPAVPGPRHASPDDSSGGTT